ncbi:MAG TPA: hypothetical protein DHW42_05260 [Candidatus Marinimicrobia bacterium]|nr:hypothetical protein [Candidatus Neomarinimicrobiota bacterium]
MTTEILKINKKSHRILLNAIRTEKEIGGAELSRMARYQPSIIVYILRSSEKSGLMEIDCNGIFWISAIKPPVLWLLVSDRRYIIGLEIIVNEIRTKVIGFACNIFHQEMQKISIAILLQTVNLVMVAMSSY